MKKRANSSQKPNVQKTFFWITIAILLVVSFIIIRPFVISLISAFLLAFLIKPVYNWLTKYTNKPLSALICIALIILILLIPISLIANKLIYQIDYSQANNLSLPDSVVEKINTIPFIQNIDFSSLKEKGVSLILSIASVAPSYLISLVLSLIITFIGIYYILIYWNNIVSELRALLPFKDKNKIETEISHTTTHLIHGYFLIALLEFIVSAIGFYISGVTLYLFFPFLIAIFAFIPLLGTGAVWIPLAIYYIFIGSYTAAGGIIITGIIVSILIDRILAAKIMQDKAKINPLIFILGILGGVPLFGIFGIIIGPLILTYALKFINNAITDR
ncbi:MAG: AI-2E family transporter [Nanoarchaeota archaeon]